MIVQFMTRKGARTVAMGGRPASGPMQAASGTRGARAYSSSSLDGDMVVVGLVDQEVANKTLPPIPPNAQTRDPGLWSAAYFNLRDQIREDELQNDDAVPLQFKYEAADCRLYYTLRSLYSMTQQWTDAHDTAWGDGSRCVSGSTDYSTTGQTDPAHKPLPPGPSRRAPVVPQDLHASPFPRELRRQPIILPGLHIRGRHHRLLPALDEAHHPLHQRPVRGQHEVHGGQSQMPQEDGRATGARQGLLARLPRRGRLRLLQEQHGALVQAVRVARAQAEHRAGIRQRGRGRQQCVGRGRAAQAEVVFGAVPAYVCDQDAWGVPHLMEGLVYRGICNVCWDRFIPILYNEYNTIPKIRIRPVR